MPKRNPVNVYDSIEALDLIAQCFELLRKKKEAALDLIDRLREQKLRHARALRHVIGTEAV